jgi:hypothetical protein
MIIRFPFTTKCITIDVAKKHRIKRRFGYCTYDEAGMPCLDVMIFGKLIKIAYWSKYG